MNEKAARFFEGMRGARVCLIGAGVSHRALIRLFAEKGAKVTLRDRRSREQLDDDPKELEDLGVRLVLGEDYLKDLDEEMILRTPGMRFYTPQLNRARAQGRVVTSEMELFFDLCPCPILGITGSDGKTTTSTIIATMLKREGYHVHLGGNIGRALLPIVEEIEPTDLAVVELSSFQLISMRRSPDVAVVTNVAPNHLDMHQDMQEYVDAKKNLLLHQGAHSLAVLNADNEITAHMAALTRGNTLLFSRLHPVERGTFLDENGDLFYVDNGEQEKLLNRQDIRIPGLHNVENYLAAIAAVYGYVSPQTIREVAREFGGVEHRIEFVRELDGVRWYNDSIATNPTRTIAGLNCFDQKLILIAGGYDKKLPFEPLAPKILEKVRVLILTGATAQKIEEAVTTCPGYCPGGPVILHAQNLEEAVQRAREAARPGETVTLSPACASFDSYPNFEARGHHFKELVNALDRAFLEKGGDK